jgi:hypothetical protein
MKRTLLLLTTLFLSLAFTPTSSLTGSYPQNYFRSPVEHDILLSGTFGELRPNHFHAGIDIKSSRGVSGDPIFAAAEGFVAKIRVEESGYGRSLYLAHPNGYTTLYAHLEKFSPELETYVKQEQYARQSFEVELKPGAERFPVAKGEPIGVMGNTGASNGAHLHFEVRETSTQNPINPLLFGFDVVDNIAPRMHSLKVYLLSDAREAKDTKTFSLYKLGDKYRVKGDTITVATRQAGFALKVYDHFDRVSNWNGIFSLSMYQNDSLLYDFKLETFSFDETRYLNAHCDYVERVTKNSYYNRCYTLPGNQLSIYKMLSDYGVVNLRNDKPSKITMIASDVNGNSTKLEYWVKSVGATEATFASKGDFNYILPFNEGSVIQTDGIYLNLPPGTLYETLYMKYQTSPERSSGYYSHVHHIHNSKTPVHNYFEIGIRPTVSVPAELKSKIFVAYCEGGSITNCGGNWQDGYLRTKARAFGDYAIMVDVTPPVIRPVNFQYNMRATSKMVFKISDNVNTASNVKGLTYEATIDGNWVLMEFDKKTASLSLKFDDTVGKGEHEFKLVVIDAVGNETVYEKKFVR